MGLRQASGEAKTSSKSCEGTKAPSPAQDLFTIPSIGSAVLGGRVRKGYDGRDELHIALR